jgi:crotonobetainyl-CoA:carnitine CoA-transferase CaiB-like acyl-CoA transferase
MGILSGIRVIDCATYIAAPAAATIMSDFGAEVIKIERPPHGDPYRYLSQVPGLPSSDLPYCWILDGRNKRSVALNLAEEPGREALLKLVQNADVFITNYQPPLLRQFRLCYEHLSPLNERLIYAHLTGYGDTGPEVDKPGYDMTAYWARSGLMSYIHQGDAEPAHSPAGFGDHPTSMTMFSAIMLALYEREKTGRGRKVGTSLIANGAWSHSCMIQAALVGAQFPEKSTRRTAVNPLVNHYTTLDGRRVLFCLLDPVKDWRNLCRAIGLPALIDDVRFSTPAARRGNGEFVDMLDAAIGAKDYSDWVRIFAENDVIWGPVPSAEDAPHDPQMQANGVFADLDHPARPLRTVTNPIRLEGEAQEQPRPAPAVGEHTAEVLRELGYDDQAISKITGVTGSAATGK